MKHLKKKSITENVFCLGYWKIVSNKSYIPSPKWPAVCYNGSDWLINVQVWCRLVIKVYPDSVKMKAKDTSLWKEYIDLYRETHTKREAKATSLSWLLMDWSEPKRAPFLLSLLLCVTRPLHIIIEHIITLNMISSKIFLKTQNSKLDEFKSETF